MIVRRFLLWARHAPAADRAEAVGALARAFLDRELKPSDHAEAETALTAMLDDPSALVRRTMAENLAGSPHAPRHVILALASNDSEIAAPVLTRSPLLEDSDLVDCAALGDERVQVAIASRAALSPAVSAALAEIAVAPAVLVLARNRGAEIAQFSLARMLERHGTDGALCEALLARPNLPVEITQTIAATLAEVLGARAAGGGWVSAERSGRFTRDASERATIALSAQLGTDEMARLVAHLRRSGQLSAALILRAILSCGFHFAEAAFAELSEQPLPRVAAILRDRRGGSFRALYGRAGMPETLRPAFEVAFSALQQLGGAREGTGLSRALVARVLAEAAAMPTEAGGRLLALLRRFEVEAALEEARGAADAMADDAALAIVLQHAPEELLATPVNRRLIAA